MSDPKPKTENETPEGLETDADAPETKSENEDLSEAENSQGEPALDEAEKSSDSTATDDGVEDAEIVDEDVASEAGDTSEGERAGDDQSSEPGDHEATDDATTSNEFETEPETQPEPEQVAARSEPEPEKTVVEKRGGFFGPFLGGVVAAGLGFGLCYYLVDQGVLGLNSEDAFAEDRAQIAGLTEQISTLQTEIADLQSGMEGLGEDPRVGPLADGLSATEGVVSTLQDEIGTLQSEIEAQGALLAGVGSQIESVEAQLQSIADMPEGTGSADAAAIAALRAQLQAQQTEMQAQQAENEEMQAQIQGMADAARAEMDEVRARAGALQAETQAAVDDATNRAALANLTSALDSGTPLAPALASITGDVPEALNVVADTGVLTVLELQQTFPAAARAGLSDSLKVTVGDAPGDRLMAFLQAQVGARSLEAREGDDPDAILARAQSAVSSARFADALAEIAALPSEGQAAMAGWTGDAQARVDAVAARDALAAELISN